MKNLPRCPAELNEKVVREMDRTGANNHLISKYFYTIANFAYDNLDNPGFSEPMKEPETHAEKLAARLVMDYLSKNKMNMALKIVEQEAHNVGFSSENKSSPKVLKFTKRYPPIKKLIRQRMCIPDEEGWYEIDSQNSTTIIGTEPLGTTFDAQTIIDKIDRQSKASQEESLIGYARSRSPLQQRYGPRRRNEPTNFSVKSKSLSNKSGASSMISHRSTQPPNPRSPSYNQYMSNQNRSVTSSRRVFPH